MARIIDDYDEDLQPVDEGYFDGKIDELYGASISDLPGLPAAEFSDEEGSGFNQQLHDHSAFKDNYGSAGNIDLEKDYA